MGLLDGKVAVITGAGGGLGRAHALLFAQEGAKVCVNDLGGSRDGIGESTSLADQVVAEIREAGGEAVANYDSVADFEGARNLIKTATDAFGTVDILVNNAGILRDKTMLKMEEGMFDLVVAVHLKGSWNCAKHAAQVMVDDGHGGRIISTSSIAGLKGNFGQTNYGSAKAGIWGLTNSLALEMKRYGITANAIAPMAKTRMTDDIDLVPDEMLPEHISPVVLWLASELAEDVNGRCFGVHGKQLFEYKMEMTDGVELTGDDVWTPSEIERRLPEIERLGPPPAPAGAAPAGAPRELTPEQMLDKVFARIPEVFIADKAKGWTASILWKVEDAGDYTIDVKDGACTSKKGAPDQPTCTVKLHRDTMLGMVDGSVNPQQAFMQGKIGADNLGDMMKFGSAFDMKKAKALVDAEKAAAAAAAPSAPAAAAKEPTPEEQLDLVFERIPEVFIADKAKGWNASIVWKVEAAADYTIDVKDGTCTSKKGASDSPTCTVKLHRDTMLGMVNGTVNPQQAFMQGKIAADNLGDMMKFGGAFDMKKAKALVDAAKAGAASAPAAAAAAPAKKAEPTPKEICAEAFARMPELFVPEKAAGWKAAILWKIEGAGDFTVNVDETTCTADEGAPEKATCTVKLSADTFLGMISGKVNPQKAFMAGKITADNLGDMMKFGTAFDMKKGAQMAKEAAERHAAASAAPAAAAPAPAPAKPKLEGLNRALIGKRYMGGAHFARPDDLKAYAGATNDPNPHYTGENGDQVAPPIFPVKVMADGLFGALSDPDLNLDLLRMVHGEQDMRFLKPIRPWDLITVRAYVESIVDKSAGQLLTMRVPCYVEGEVACEARAVLFCKGKKKDGGKKEPKPEQPEREIAFSQTMQVTDDQSFRYAEVSGDDNPIHTDDDIAKMAGLPGIILHGLCTMAFTSRAVVQELCGGDPLKLKRLAVRFSKPVFPGEALTTQGWRLDEQEGVTTYGFETTNDTGTAVITNGLAEVVG